MSDTDSSPAQSLTGNKPQAARKNAFERRLSKRLSYILRYGAEKEGIKVLEGGYVEWQQLLKAPMLKNYDPLDIVKEVGESLTEKGNKRFEKKYENKTVYVRATYMRRMERNPNHEGTNVPRLLESCSSYICDNIKHYDLQDFPDEFLVSNLIDKLKRTNRLNNKAFASLLGPVLEHLDLGGTMITEKTIKLIGERCPNLMDLNLRESGYIVNDHMMEFLLKRLPLLKNLNLSGCSDLTDRTLAAIAKHCQNIRSVNLNHVPNITQTGVLHLITTAPNLEHLDIFHNQNINEEGRKLLKEFVSQRDAVVVLDRLDLDADAKEDASIHLPSFRKQ